MTRASTSTQNCDASAALVCTGRGTHAQLVIELFDRIDGRWVADPDNLGLGLKRWKDMVLSYRLERGDPDADRELVYRNGRLDSGVEGPGFAGRGGGS